MEKLTKQHLGSSWYLILRRMQNHKKLNLSERSVFKNFLPTQNEESESLTMVMVTLDS